MSDLLSNSSRYSTVSKTYQGAYVSSPIDLNMSQEIVPRFPSLGYAALTHGGVGNGMGYYNVGGAYPAAYGSCTRYGLRSCNGLVQKPPGSTFAMGQGAQSSICCIR